MPYLLDASNLGGALAGRSGSRDAAAVVRFLLPWVEGRGRVVALFDGPEQGDVAARYGALEVVWSGGRSADDAIVARLRGAASDWIVVTSDRELARRCRALGARVERAPDLLRRVGRPHPDDPSPRRRDDKPEPSAEDRAHWMKVFGKQ